MNLEEDSKLNLKPSMLATLFHWLKKIKKTDVYLLFSAL